MVDIYVKYTDGDFYKLDLEGKESINFKATSKDLTDISTIFAPFTQAFTVKSTDKNKMIFGFIGDEKSLRLNSTNEFDCKIYIGGFLFQTGKLTVDETNYNYLVQQDYKCVFANGISGLKDRIGDDILQDLFDIEDPNLSLEWSVPSLIAGLQTTTNKTLSNGIEIFSGIPFASNYRVWQFDQDFKPESLDNIAFKKWLSPDYVRLNEVRPALSYASIIKSAIKKYDLNIEAPIFERPEFNELFVWCNNEKLSSTKETIIVDYNAISPVVITSSSQEIGSSPIPTSPRFVTSLDAETGVFTITDHIYEMVRPDSWLKGINFKLEFVGFQSTGTAENGEINLTMLDIDGNSVNVQSISNGIYELFIPETMFIGGVFSFKMKIKSVQPSTWTEILYDFMQTYRYTRGGIFGNFVNKATYEQAGNNTVSPALFGASAINLATSLPATKVFDFLQSFFRMFNIQSFQTGKDDLSMYWLVPNDLKENNKPYSAREEDYTKYTDIETITKKKANQYNCYNFSHLESKYYSNISYKKANLREYGQILYPDILPKDQKKYEIKTVVSIVPPVFLKGHDNVRTIYGFTSDDGVVSETGHTTYKPNYDELTIFYLNKVALGDKQISVQGGNALNSILEPLIYSSNSKSLGFDIIEQVPDTLYSQYYAEQIERLLNVNTLAHSVNINLDSDKIYLNFANQKQGESNIPLGFRLQNYIIIGEQRYSIIDAQIELSTGKSKFNLMNF